MILLRSLGVSSKRLERQDEYELPESALKIRDGIVYIVRWRVRCVIESRPLGPFGELE